jgi:hypothetical protein
MALNATHGWWAPGEGRLARVFVSYARADRECAGQLHQWLIAEGHEVFLDQDPGNGIAVGEEWDKRLHERLRWADAVVCVVTSAAVASTWCTAEVSFALSRGNRLLPVRAEPGVEHPLLTSVQYADLTVDSGYGLSTGGDTPRLSTNQLNSYQYAASSDVAGLQDLGYVKDNLRT